MSRRNRNTIRSREDGWEVWGGYMNAKRRKLQDQFDKEAPNQLKKEGSGSKIFNGISIHVDGYTNPSSDELKRLMMLHGGSYEHYLYRTRVTHVIATNLPNCKVRELKGLKVVKPQWITDSIAAGKLLSYTNYLLYTAQTGLQTGLRGFSVSENRDQSGDVTMTIAKTGLCSAQNNSESLIANTSTHVTNSREHVLSNKENLSVIDCSTADQIGTSFNQNQTVTTQRSPENSFTNLPSHSHMSTPHTSSGKAGDPNFINEYYNNSRLHFLSTWKAEFKSYVNELQKQGTIFPGRERLRKAVHEQDMLVNGGRNQGRHGKPARCVMHIDMDCFFVSVGLKNRPDLKGKPVAVTHSKGKSAVQDPESDLAYEKQQWEQKRLNGGKKGKRAVNNAPYIDSLVEDTSFPDKSDSDDDIDDTCNVSIVTKTTTEPFHSMAEIASCSYEARQCGVKNGMFMGKAKTLCPELVTIPYDFEQYKAVSKILYDTVASYSHDIEAVSCDEMLVDCTELLDDTGATPSQFASLLRDEIYNKTGCCASAGLASNVLLAKMATRKAKPNGQFHLPSDLVIEFIKPQSVKDIPGVGWSLTKRLEAMKVLTCGDLQRVAMETLQREFGPKTGQSLYKYCRGEDDRSVKIEQQRKSVSAEVNYGIRFNNDSDAYKFIQELSTEVCSRLQAIHMKGKTITLKLMIRREDAPKQTSKFMGHGICNNFSKSVSLPMATDDPKTIGQECLSILRQQKCVASDLRGIGIQIQKLEPSVVGNPNNSKYPSILNFTVSKSNNSDKPVTSKSEKVHSNSFVNQSSRHQDVLRDEARDQSRLLEHEKNGREHTNSAGGTSSADHDIKGGTYGSNSLGFNSDKQEISDSLHVANISNSNPIRGDISIAAATQDIEDLDLDVSTQSTDTRDIVVGEIGADSSDLLKDLGRRQIKSSQLPPLPCLPEIKSPENSQTDFVDVKTPQGSRQHGTEERDPVNKDYFPSPSQIDPEVLKELPAEIRQQVEKEMESRQKSQTATDRRTRSSQGCSHWQQPVEGHPEQNSHSQESNLDNIPQVREDHSRNSSLSRGSHSIHTTSSRGGYPTQNETRQHNVKSDIVPLPSSSQLDLSCLNALPESLQDEILQAYAMQGQNTTENQQGPTMMNLQQAKSPQKSPNKRSPAKKSPQFKVPRGRPNTRGRKKGSSKKLVFKDQSKQDSRVVEKGQSHGRVSDTDDQTGTSVTNNRNTYTENSSDGQQVTTADTVESHGPDTIDYQVPDTVDPSSVDTADKDGAGIGTVNLCGAVKMVEVRSLIKEWVSSTPVPQSEDEEVLLEYINALVRDKNLEQVDLVLKAMYRNINKMENVDWLLSLQRIFTETQSIVRDYHGYGLRSISL